MSTACHVCSIARLTAFVAHRWETYATCNGCVIEYSAFNKTARLLLPITKEICDVFRKAPQRSPSASASQERSKAKADLKLPSAASDKDDGDSEMKTASPECSGDANDDDDRKDWTLTSAVSGGILADEMGLGKSVELISLVLTNPKYEC